MSFEDLLKSLQQDYLASLPEKITILKSQAAACAADDLRESFHKLKGTGRTYGLPEVSELAELAESICLARPHDAVTAAGTAIALLQDIHSARMSALGFNLHADPRFEQIRKLAPA